MRCLITGVKGLVGSNLSAVLSQSYGWDVIGLSSSSSDEPRCFKADISNGEALDRIAKKIGKVDLVIHCAALIDMSADPVELFKSNLLGTLNVLAFGKALMCRKIINISSVPVIGRIRRLPITENDVCCPLTGYHLSKLQAEQCLDMYAGDRLDCVSLRIPSPVGINMPLRSIFPILLGNALEGRPIRLSGDSRRRQDFLDLRDLAAAVANVFGIDHLKGVYQIASGRAIGNLELATKLVELTNSRSIIINEMSLGTEDAEEWVISTDKARRDFGYRSNYTLEDTVRWLLKGGL